MATLSFEQYKQAMTIGGIRPIIQMELLRKEDESVYDSIIAYTLEGSSLTVTNQNGCRRSVSLVLDNSNGRFNPNPNGGLWINTKFKLSVGIEDTNKNTILFSQGVFCLSNSEPEFVSDPQDGYIVNIKADDKWSLFQNGIGKMLQIPKGSNINQQIAILLKRCNDTKTPILPTLTNSTLYDMRWGLTDNYDTVFKDLGNLYHTDCFYDVGGNFKLDEFQDIATLETIWNYSKDQVHYMGASRVQQYDKVKNHVIVYSSATDNKTYSGEAINTDDTTATSVHYIYDRTVTIQNDKLWSDDMCRQQAEHTLSQLSRTQECISLKSIFLPHFTVNKAFTLTDENIGLRNRARYAIQAIQMPLDFKSEMTITAYKFNDADDFQDRWTESGNELDTTSA